MARRGSQSPRLHVAVPAAPVAYDSVDDISMLSESLDVRLFPWQKLVLHDWTARDDHDNLVFPSDGLSVPRQNGKNLVVEILEVYCAAVCGWHILHTAHQVRTAKESFERLCSYFKEECSHELFSLVKSIRRTNGEEAIYLKNGGSVQFSSRSTSGRRGFSDIQLIIFDEAQELASSQLEALLYTLAASKSGERQIIYMGTPPEYDTIGDVFPRFRSGALSSPVPGTSWIEWSVEHKFGKDATWTDVIDAVYETNPSLGYSSLSEAWTANEFASDGIVGFCIERLGWWRSLEQAFDKPIGADAWDAAAVERIDGARYGKRVAFGVKFSPDGSAYAVSGAKLSETGDVAVELIMTGGTGDGMQALAAWLAARAKRVACVVIDGQGSAFALRNRLAELKVPARFVLDSSPQVVVQASALLVDSLADGSLVHSKQDTLRSSAVGSVRRWVGRNGGWSFGNGNNSDSTPIESVALAIYGVKHSKRTPGRRQELL